VLAKSSSGGNYRRPAAVCDPPGAGFAAGARAAPFDGKLALVAASVTSVDDGGKLKMVQVDRPWPIDLTTSPPEDEIMRQAES